MAYRNPPGAGPGVVTQVTCSSCGKETSVPFAPTPGRPVFCRECFAQRAPPRAGGGGGGGGGGGQGGRFGGGGGGAGGGYGRPRGPPSGPGANTRQRMMAQGRKGHFMYDARAVLERMEGGMDDQHIRAFLEGLFARGARTSTAAAQEFLDEKLAAETITLEQRNALGQLVERYSFWR